MLWGCTGRTSWHLSTPSLGITVVRVTSGTEIRPDELSTPSLGITLCRRCRSATEQFRRAFNSLSRDHGLKRTADAEGPREDTVAFNSLSRDHAIIPESPVSIEDYFRSFNSLSRDHASSTAPASYRFALLLSTPSLGITDIFFCLLDLLPRRLSTPSLGITVNR